MVSHMAWWQSGYAEDCKSLYAGSIPTQASRFKSGAYRFYSCKKLIKFLPFGLNRIQYD